MQYLGGKSRLASSIVKSVQDTLGYAPPRVFDPFCGGGSVALAFARAGTKVEASDVFPGLAALHKATCEGFRLGPTVEEAEYRACKGKTDPKSLAILFGVSFGGKYGGGLARPPETYIRHFNSWAEKITAVAHSVSWTEQSYEKIKVGPGDVIYCDPPYADTEGYATGDFDSQRFFDWCAYWSGVGAHVFVSEFSAPFEFREVWRKERKIALSHTKQRKVDCLFYLKPSGGQ